MTHRRDSEARIGPNALIQTVRALRDEAGDDLARDLLALGGMAWLLERSPDAMIPEAQFHDLVGILIVGVGETRTHALLHHSGALTAGYLLQHRIPYPFQRVLGLLPRRLRLRLLLAAISRNAWTFVGSGRFSYQLGQVPRLRIVRADQVASPVFSFYAGTFQALFAALVDPSVGLKQWPGSDSEGSACDYAITFGERGVGQARLAAGPDSSVGTLSSRR